MSRQSLRNLEIEEKDVKNQIIATEQDASKEIILQQKIDTLENRKDQTRALFDSLKQYEQALKDLERMTIDENDLSETMKRYKGVIEKLEEERRILEKGLKEAKDEITPLESVVDQLNSLCLKI